MNLLQTLQRLLPGRRGQAEYALVERVIDGDSIRLVDGREVRYLDIDTPETYPDNPEWRWARRAREANARLVEGRRVRLEREGQDRDHYGRLLRHVYVGRTWVNAALVSKGLARVRTGHAGGRRAAALADLQARARRRGRGLWRRRKPWQFWR